jgi:hypothetical protein
MGPAALCHLREMEEIAAGLADLDSAEAWRDIADAARVILLTPTSDPARPPTQPWLPTSRESAD